MSFFVDILGSLGLGSQLTLAGTLLVAAFYALRMVSGARTVGAILSNGVAYGVAIVVAAALAIGLGWVDPSIATATDHVTTAGEWVWSVSGGYVLDLVEGVVP